MKAMHLYVGHGVLETISVLVFDNGTHVYFAEDDNIMVIDRSEDSTSEPREYVEGTDPEIDRYIGYDSDPTLLYELEQYKMSPEMKVKAKTILGL